MHIEAMQMSLTTAADNDVELDGVDDWSSIDIVQVVVLLQLRGCKESQGWNNIAQD